MQSDTLHRLTGTHHHGGGMEREREREVVVHTFFDPGPSVYAALSDGTVRSVLLTV